MAPPDGGAMAARTTTRTVLVAVTLAVASLLLTARGATVTAAPAPVAPAPTTTTTTAAPAPVIVEAAAAAVTVDPEVADLMEWARERFAAAGLEFPEVSVHAHEPSDEHHHAALYVGFEDGSGEIHLYLGGDHAEIVERRVLLHELSHAWVHRNLDEADKVAFMQLRGLDEWAEPAPWYLRATEHAAEIMAWGLLDVELPVYTVLPNDTDSLTTAFVALTGVGPTER